MLWQLEEDCVRVNALSWVLASSHSRWEFWSPKTGISFGSKWL